MLHNPPEAGPSDFQSAAARWSALASNMVGHLGAAPSVSPIRTARIAVFLVPDEKLAKPRGIAPRSAQCQCAVLLLADGSLGKVERAPGLAPDKSGVAVRRFDYFSIARSQVVEMVLTDGFAPSLPRLSTVFLC